MVLFWARSVCKSTVVEYIYRGRCVNAPSKLEFEFLKCEFVIKRFLQIRMRNIWL